MRRVTNSGKVSGWRRWVWLPVMVAGLVPLTGQAQEMRSDTLTNMPAESRDVPQEPVEVAAQFPGGEEAMWAFLRRHLRYPRAARLAEVTGRVVVLFCVEPDGRVGEVFILRGVCDELDAEALRVVRMFPPFAPATRDGQPVRSCMSVRIGFGR